MKTHISDLDYDYMLTNWDQRTDVFLQWGRYVCGGNENTLEQLSRLIKNDDELASWIELFDGDFDNFEKTSKMYIEQR